MEKEIYLLYFGISPFSGHRDQQKTSTRYTGYLMTVLVTGHGTKFFECVFYGRANTVQ